MCEHSTHEGTYILVSRKLSDCTGASASYERAAGLLLHPSQGPNLVEGGSSNPDLMVDSGDVFSLTLLIFLSHFLSKILPQT